ncbi:FMNH2-utilizing oxygenase [Asanoa ishikariensis]|uniref:Flavin-dependent oxidoreductase, luciferase family (Includes alkanesulfonate monooxygenase SsuD and methylene tetrahydromethanopterin reductase) n=1 Tax=Asanoa ishikariensis TaxID=137265 RepID=A0A1H3UJA0_9ACTN|nr:LLM class flavin-dependent oxidoreductase [Asanoa ishikariensis]GIF63347.1 FMNH2-utilizing oxygenase [Asanoa ishikariensis]SDZ62533.1 Flavin-dependent oxidoreductase, luciferase family (includes alkanesulfonate monooxygenase SsuD and methylene tetrahydromethanopterin reductase) [Asanoa ishikariensis]
MTLHLAVALDGAGWHPAAWRDATARAGALFDPDYWLDLVRTAERGKLDFVTIEDALGLQSSRFDGLDGRADRVKGRLDALLVAARAAPVTSRIGLVPTVTVTHTEPFHVSTQLATLDYLSTGRAGWRPQVSARPGEADHFGRRQFPTIDPIAADDPATAAFIAERFAEAADHVEAVRRLWDSWEDDAEIRDVATGRFVDRDKLHYVDFTGRFFSVKGPSITPRPPQGQPVVTALAHARVPYEFAAASADVVYVTPTSTDDAARIVAEVRSLPAAHELKVFADVTVFLDPDRKARLDRIDPGYASDAHTYVGDPAGLADLLLDWRTAGIEGFRLRPGVLPADLSAIVDGLLPILRAHGAFRTDYTATTLRGHLGLRAAANRYATTGGAA